jgi:hypothetical protein
MSPHVTTLIVALKTITLVLGGLITYFAYKAYNRSGAKPLWYLSIGFGVVTLGTLLAGAVDQAVRLSISQRFVADTALVVESALTAIGFAVIVYSLYTTD